MEIQLTAADTAKWQSDPSWKQGYIDALQVAVADTVLVVEIRDDNNQLLATYKRLWTTV
jgi:hypothetical protein